MFNILELVSPVLDRILGMIPNPEARAQAQREITMRLVEIDAQQQLAQVELNKVEATHSSIFVAGWRPFIGWVSGVGLAWQTILQPIVSWIATVNGYTGDFPILDSGTLMTLLLAMLGVGTMRSVDKYNKVDTKFKLK